MAITAVFREDFVSTNGSITVRDSFPQTTFVVDQTDEGFFENIWFVPTTEDTLTPPNISVTGYAFLRNVSTADFVEVGLSTGDYFTRLNPGEFAWLRVIPSATTFYAIADTAPVSVQIKVWND